MVPYTEATSTRETGALPQPRYVPRLLSVRATIDKLETPIIPFAIFKSDPLDAFQQYMTMLTQQAQNTSDIQSTLCDAWHTPFASLDCKKLFFLLAWSTVPTVSPRVVQVAELMVGIATPGPLHKRWLVTSAMSRLDELVVWCVEIDMRSAIGRDRVDEIVLGEGNMIQLQQVAAIK